jgi:hypothetical protein
MPFKVVTIEEWKAKGLPTETSTIHFGNTEFLKKVKEHHEKMKKNKKRRKVCNLDLSLKTLI